MLLLVYSISLFKSYFLTPYYDLFWGLVSSTKFSSIGWSSANFISLYSLISLLLNYFYRWTSILNGLSGDLIWFTDTSSHVLLFIIWMFPPIFSRFLKLSWGFTTYGLLTTLEKRLGFGSAITFFFGWNVILLLVGAGLRFSVGSLRGWEDRFYLLALSADWRWIHESNISSYPCLLLEANILVDEWLLKLWVKRPRYSV